MEKTFFIFIALIACWGLPIHAQNNSSREDMFPSLAGTNIIVRPDSSSSDYAIIYYEDPTTGLGRFVHHDVYSPPTLQSNVYDLPTSVTFSGSPTPTNIKLTVNDMAVTKDKCYFCGTFTDLDSPSPLQLGMVGFFELTGFGNSSYNYNIFTIAGASEFYRMDVHATGTGQDNIALVGELYYASNPSGVYFVTYNLPAYSNQWDYWRFELNNTDETFTDIVFTENGEKVVAASRINNDNYTFGLHCESSSIVFTPHPINPPIPSTDFYWLNTVSTANLTLASSTNPAPTYHNNDVDIRLDQIPNSSSVVVAYECYDESKLCEPRYSVAMFKTDFSNYHTTHTASISSQQVVFNYFDSPNTLKDIKYIDDDIVSLLYNCNNCAEDMTTIIQFPKLGSFGDVDDLLTAYQHYYSLYTGISNDIFVTGKMPNGMLIHFYQDVSDPESSCYPTRPKSKSEELLGEPVIVSYSNITYYPYGGRDWGILSSFPIGTPTLYRINCKTF